MGTAKELFQQAVDALKTQKSFKKSGDAMIDRAKEAKKIYEVDAEIIKNAKKNYASGSLTDLEKKTFDKYEIKPFDQSNKKESVKYYANAAKRPHNKSISIQNSLDMIENDRAAGLKTLGKVTGETHKYYLDAGKDYLLGGSKFEKGVRAGTAALGVGAIGLGARFATGGNLTFNGDGQKDLAGIPFV